ncbi:MAG: type II CAAX endopeptidase family protein [Polyangiales bacterium]
MSEVGAQLRAVAAMSLRGAVNSLRRRQGAGAMVVFPVLVVFLLVELARFGSRATDGMRLSLSLSSPARGTHYAALWLSLLALGIAALKYARVVPGRGSRRLLDTAVFRALPVSPGTRVLVELALANTHAAGFVLLVWVPASWGLIRMHHGPAAALALTALSALVVNGAASLVAVALHEGASNRLRGRGLDVVRVLSASVGASVIGLFAALGPIGAGVSRNYRPGTGIPSWTHRLPLHGLVRAARGDVDVTAALTSVAWIVVPCALALLALRHRARHPADLSLDAPPAPVGDGRWPERLTPVRAEWRMLTRQAPYLPFAPLAFLAFFFALGKGARSATGSPLPSVVLFGLVGWSLLVMGTALSGAASRRWRRALWILPAHGVDHVAAIRAVTLVHVALTLPIALATFVVLLQPAQPPAVFFARQLVGLALAIAVGQWMQAATVFHHIDPAPDRLTGLSVGALFIVLASVLPAAALTVTLSAFPLTSWGPLLLVVAMMAWSIERAAVQRLRSVRDPDGDPDAARRTWPALRAFGFALLAQLAAMQSAETLFEAGTTRQVIAGLCAFVLVLVAASWRAWRRYAVAPRWSAARSVGAGVLAGALHFAWSSQYARWVVGASAEANPLAAAVRQGDGVQRAGFALLAVLVVPLAEELYFRAWLPNALATDLSPRWARYSAVPAAALFATVHGVATWPVAFAGALLASWLLARSGRVASCLAWHVTNNALVIAVALLGAR